MFVSCCILFVFAACKLPSSRCFHFCCSACWLFLPPLNRRNPRLILSNLSSSSLPPKWPRQCRQQPPSKVYYCKSIFDCPSYARFVNSCTADVSGTTLTISHLLFDCLQSSTISSLHFHHPKTSAGCGRPPVSYQSVPSDCIIIIVQAHCRCPGEKRKK